MFPYFFWKASTNNPFFQYYIIWFCWRFFLLVVIWFLLPLFPVKKKTIISLEDELQWLSNFFSKINAVERNQNKLSNFCNQFLIFIINYLWMKYKWFNLIFLWFKQAVPLCLSSINVLVYDYTLLLKITECASSFIL